MALAGIAVRVWRGRWFMLFASILIMAASGGTYVFGIYSKAIRSSLGYDQKTLNMLSFFKNLGASLGILPGVLYELAPTWSVMVCGAGMNLGGYLPIYFAVTKDIARPPVWLMCLCITFGAASQSFATTSALVSSVKNFPNADRGGVLGLLTGFSGLSGAIFTQLDRCFAGVGNDGAALVMLIGCLPSAISLLFTGTVRCIPRRDTGSPCRRERRALDCFLYVSIVLSVYLLAVSVVELKVPRFPKAGYYYITVIVLVVLIVSLPLVIVLHQAIHESTTATAPTSLTTDENTLSTSATVGEPPLESVAASTRGGLFSPPARGEDYSVLQALFSVDMQLLFIITILGIGGLMTAMDNIGQIGESLGYAQGTVSMLVSLASIANYAGRVVAGFGSGYVVAHYKLPRPLALTVTLVLACVGHVLIALGVRNELYAASVMVGFSLGALWSVLFAIISEVFGLKHFSTLYNLGAAASPLGSYVLNVQVTGHLYDREAHRQGGQCMGVQCFKVPFLIITGASMISVAASLVLAWRTSKFYGTSRFSISRALVDANNGDPISP